MAEGPGANIFIEKDNVLYTPQLGSILPGITRATVLELCESLGMEAVETKLTLNDVYNADSAFYCGTAAEIIGLASVDKKTFRKDWNNSLGAILQKAYKQLVLEKEFRPAEKVA